MKPAEPHSCEESFCSGKLLDRLRLFFIFPVSKNQFVLDSTLSRADLYLQKDQKGTHVIQGYELVH